MNGGQISGNTAVTAGAAAGVFSGATFTMKGGKICDNTTTTSGAVFVSGNTDFGSATFTMEGGEICNNSAGETGGAIHVWKHGTVNIKGGKIYGNTAPMGGAISVNSVTTAGGSMTISGGEFYNNKAVT